jgi:hypothetical protein
LVKAPPNGNRLAQALLWWDATAPPTSMDHVLTARQIVDLLYKCVIQQVTARHRYVIDMIEQYRAADYNAEGQRPYQAIDLASLSQMGGVAALLLPKVIARNPQLLFSRYQRFRSDVWRDTERRNVGYIVGWRQRPSAISLI